MVHIDRVAIQGEPGSNSHLAARNLLGPDVALLPCRLSVDVFRALANGDAAAAVLPIENSLHGSVADHYDLLLHYPVRITAESLLRIEHHLITAPGVALADVRRVLSHPVALSQCRRFLSEFSQAQPQPFYDTAGSVRQIVLDGLLDAAGIAPRLAAEVYGGTVLKANVEDHQENFTRFHLLQPEAALPDGARHEHIDKLSAAFSIEHRPGSLVQVLHQLADAGADLTKIESRPVPGKPWEYIFFVDLRFADGEKGAERALLALRRTTGMLRELGRYVAAGN